MILQHKDEGNAYQEKHDRLRRLRSDSVQSARRQSSSFDRITAFPASRNQAYSSGENIVSCRKVLSF